MLPPAWLSHTPLFCQAHARILLDATVQLARVTPPMIHRETKKV